MNVIQLVRDERAELADYLDTLTPQQWDSPTLCEGWSVRDLVAHVIGYDELPTGQLLRLLARARLNLRVANEMVLTEARDRSPRDLVTAVRDHLTPRGLTACFGGNIALTDGLIHHQDIRRPLGNPRHIPADRLRQVLGFAVTAPPLGARKRIRGLRLVATDIDWTAGNGPEVRGPAEPLLMAVAGRRGTAHELSGPGQPTLAERIER